MGYSLSVYSVPAGAVSNSLSSKDQDLFDRIVASKAKDLKSNDEFFEDDEQDEDEEEDVELSGCLGFIVKILGKKTEAPVYEGPKSSGPFPKSADLLHALIFGETLDSRCGAKLGYVFQMLVQHLGESEDVGSFEQMRSSSNWTGDFDGLLKQAGVGREVFSIECKLMERYAPIPVPHPYDFPAYGYLLADEAKLAQPVVQASKIDELAAAHQYGEVAVQAAEAVKGWINKAADQNRDIFGFYY
ncbi:MAG: hypothetical protein WCK51_14825 [Armatimonadota bacterium]